MLKGQAEIILTNADGTEQRMMEDNMFTNAINNLVNCSQFYFLHNKNDSYAKYLSSLTPIWKHLLGGILLFRDPIPEDVNTIIPPNGNKNTGYASNTANAIATNNLLGSYNEYESGLMDDGSYRHVWEWNTSQANGTTSCICLTSRLGGLCGWDSDTEPTNATFLASLISMDGETTSSTVNLGVGNTGNKIVDIESTDDYFRMILATRVYENNIYKPQIIELKFLKKVTLKSKYGNYYRTTTTIDMPKYYYGSLPIDYFTPNAKEHIFSYGYTPNGGTESYIVVINLLNKEVTRHTVSKIGNATEFAVAVINGYAYIPRGSVLYKVNLTDGTVKEIILPTSCYSVVIMENKLLLCEDGSDHWGKTLIYELDNDVVNGYVKLDRISTSGETSLIHTTVNMLPVIDACYAYKYAGNNLPSYIPHIITPYLATINNLATPIVKDNTQTLKVIYTTKEV